MPRTVAVTGATGFIGSHLVRHLVDAGYGVRLLTRRMPVSPIFGDRGVDAVIGGLEDSDSLRQLLDGADAVIHAAGLIKASSREAYFSVNVAGVRRLAEAAAQQANPLRLVLLSSLAAREPQLSDYAASKRAGETALTQSAGGLAWSIVRPPAVYGPGDRETLAFFRAAKRGLIPVPSGQGARLSMIHVEDLADSVIAVMNTETAIGRAFEVDDGKPGGYSWEELAQAAGAALGGTPRLVRVPRPALAALGAMNRLGALMSGRTPMLSPGKIREICHADWACRDRALGELCGWQARRSLSAGFAQTVGWYRAHGWL